MVRRGVASDECARNWETLHQTPKDHSPNVTRFFKIMFGRDYSKVLYLPPMFARSVRHLAGQETQIEDSSGHRWPVTFSYVNGSLTFHNGWSKFIVDHGLKEGHFLVFNYINGSYFDVQIFGESACEMTNFDNVRPRRSKRLKINPETISVDEPFRTLDINSREKPSSADSIAYRSEFQNCQTCPLEVNANITRLCRPISTNMEDPSCIIDRRDDGCYQEGRDILYDLSCFEMKKKTPDVNKFEKPPLCHAGITEQNNAKADDNARMDVIHANEINGHPNGVDKFEEALRTNIDSSRTESTKIDTKMAVIHSNQISGNSGEICVEKFDRVSDNKATPSHTVKTGQTEMAVIHKNQINGNSDEIFVDKFEKVSNKKLFPHAVKMDQTKTNRDDTQMAAIRSEKINAHSGDILTDKFRAKPSDNSNLSQKVQDDVSDSRNGDNHLRASDTEFPYMDRSKIAEIDYGVKHRCRETSVASSVLKNSFGQRVLKNEQVELNDEGKEKPIIVKEDGQMYLPVVKVEPDLPYDTVPSDAISPFSAEVESQSYLELPVHIPSAPGRRERGRGKVVYLRDPSGRLWPMLYPDIFTVKALTGNWRRFCKQNGIKLGDECRFQVENEKMCYYRIDVVTHGHRDDEFPK